MICLTGQRVLRNSTIVVKTNERSISYRRPKLDIVLRFFRPGIFGDTFVNIEIA